MYLSSWKEIAEYLHTSVRTAQRWERYSNLPVRRAGSRNIIAAIPQELEQWRHAQRRRPSNGSQPGHALVQLQRVHLLVTDLVRNLDIVRRSTEKLQFTLVTSRKARLQRAVAKPSTRAS
jgi:hypothetical protein